MDIQHYRVRMVSVVGQIMRGVTYHLAWYPFEREYSQTAAV